MTRNAERSAFDIPTRLYLVEKDADEFDVAMVEVRTKTAADISEIRRTMGKILWAFVGMVISLATSVLLLALNLVVNR